VIPDEAVEAAARALWDVDRQQTDKPYEDCRDATKRHLRREVRAVLEAAAPHLTRAAQFDAWNEGYKAGEIDGAYQLNGHEEPDQRNPYRQAPK